MDQGKGDSCADCYWCAYIPPPPIGVNYVDFSPPYKFFTKVYIVVNFVVVVPGQNCRGSNVPIEQS